MTALVTGGTRGIGLAITDALRQQGARTLVLSRSTANRERWLYKADIGNRMDLERVRQELVAEGIVPRILVANAGTIVRMPFVEMDDSDLRNLVTTNLYGTLTTLRVFAPLMLQRPGARFIIVSSIAAIHGLNLRVVYSATKAALAGLVRSLAIEWGPQAATVNAVAPGIVRTSLTESYMERHPERADAARNNTPLGRLAEPADIADVVAAMASDAFRFVTGQLIAVDGGFSAGSAWW